MGVANSDRTKAGILKKGLVAFVQAHDRTIWIATFVVLCLLFSLFTVYDQITERIGIEFLLTKQLERHWQILAGTSLDPWQYRIFPEYVVGAALRLGRMVGLSSHEIKAFAAVRLAQNLLIFLASGIYWRQLGLKRLHTLIALAFLAWGVSYSGYGSGLAVSTYFDILFFVLAGLIILSRRYVWLIPLMVVATLNRETSGLIPIMLIASVLQFKHWRKTNRKALAIAAASMAIYALEYTLVRMIFGSRPLSTPYGQELGLNMLVYNLTDAKTYSFVFATLSIAPLVALVYWKRWPDLLQRFFWAIVPIWLLVHLFLGVLAEARLLLVPQVLIFIPAALLVVQEERS